MEYMTFRLRLQKDKGNAFWEKWDTYLTQRGDNLPCLWYTVIRENNDDFVIVSGDLLIPPFKFFFFFPYVYLYQLFVVLFSVFVFLVCYILSS